MSVIINRKIGTKFNVLSKKFLPIFLNIPLIAALGVHPYRAALQLFQCGRSTYRDDNHGHFWRISDYLGRLVHRQRDGNAGQPSCGMLKQIYIIDTILIDIARPIFCSRRKSWYAIEIKHAQYDIKIQGRIEKN